MEQEFSNIAVNPVFNEPPHDDDFVPGQLAEPEEAKEKEINFDNFTHCFHCGADKGGKVKLKVIGNEQLCQKCGDFE